MKKLLATVFCLALVLTGCNNSKDSSSVSDTAVTTPTDSSSTTRPTDSTTSSIDSFLDSISVSQSEEKMVMLYLGDNNYLALSGIDLPECSLSTKWHLDTPTDISVGDFALIEGSFICTSSNGDSNCEIEDVESYELISFDEAIEGMEIPTLPMLTEGSPTDYNTLSQLKNCAVSVFYDNNGNVNMLFNDGDRYGFMSNGDRYGLRYFENCKFQKLGATNFLVLCEDDFPGFEFANAVNGTSMKSFVFLGYCFEESVLENVVLSCDKSGGYHEGLSSVQGIITSTAELKDYYKRFGDVTPSSKYNDSFFENTTLFLYSRSEGSGSIEIELADITVTDEGKVVMNVKRTTPSVGTADMAEWFLSAEVPNELLYGVDLSDFTVGIEEILRTSW